LKRWPYGRDLGLSIRMGIALVPIVLWYLLVGALLAGMGFVLTRSWAPNAFSVGLTEDRAVIAFTTELFRRDLTAPELEAVIAHELAHVANRDGVVMTFVSAPALVGSAMWHSEDWRAKALFVLVYWPFFVVGLVTMWALSRYREYVADRGAALITGAPEQLMSALQKLAGAPARGDLRGGLAVQALCIVPSRRHGWRRFELFSDHPPLRKRLARLAELSRELGEAA
jgi:heat shock protein HtpX